MMQLKPFIVMVFCLCSLVSFSQGGSRINLKVLNEQSHPLSSATVSLYIKKDSSLVKVQVTDSLGETSFKTLPAGDYFYHVSYMGYAEHFSAHFFIPDDMRLDLPAVTLHPSANALTNVTVSARKPFVEMKPGKTIVNVEAGITNVGATAMEALEKMPGITVDKDGNISLKGRNGVAVLIDGKQTFLDAAQLSVLLSGINASQISQVEIMDQPSSKYDASGNAGVINIKLKKNQQKGFNGSINSSFAQGFYPKNNNSLQLNYRNGPANIFLNYSTNVGKSFTRIYALRKYFEPDETTVASMLEQPSFFTGKIMVHNIRTGIDYSINKKTSAGIILNGLLLNRNGNTSNTALWLDANRATDSLIETHSSNDSRWRNGGINFNFRHAFDPNRQITVDVDRIIYSIDGNQFFENSGVFPTVYNESTRADLPSDIQILSAKADYTGQIKKWKLESGVKTSHIKTDNLAAYEFLDGSAWKEDLGKSNHFLYNETIHAVYASTETKTKRWNVQAGLRYELTNYDARQLGNAVVKDSSFSRSYNSLFPSAFASYEADSLNTFSFSAGRRIDRPPFQKLNPFVFIINKYTYQAGNPFFRPQYTWNFEFSHLYKNILITSLSYSVTHDYFSQIFPVDSNGIVVYTEGNLKRLQSFGASVALQLSPATWWSFSSQINLIHKKMEGFIEKAYSASVTQGNFNLNNQLRFNKGWGGEISGFYVSKSRNDIQEVIDPAGQFSIGVSKTVLKNKGTVKLAVRDIFYTQWMKGLTRFTLANEYFKLTRDTRVITVSFNYRFGKMFKTEKRSQGSAGEEIQRVGNG
jgi:iron complex outermembrane receptor protein